MTKREFELLQKWESLQSQSSSQEYWEDRFESFPSSQLLWLSGAHPSPVARVVARDLYPQNYKLGL